MSAIETELPTSTHLLSTGSEELTHVVATLLCALKKCAQLIVNGFERAANSLHHKVQRTPMLDAAFFLQIISNQGRA